MSGAKEKTHKHRNVIDDILDLGLLVLMVAWYFTGVDVDKETLAMIGGSGASARVLLRRILMNLWGAKLGIKDPSEGDTPTLPPDEPDSPEEEEPADDAG